ncbi:hypothetical protein FUAX_17450 [Fulvitalea axinellae]|uniref:Transposase n=1 Tax=Fulvitalea axinellae TaxID=1182444 RepID=A0AAU9CH11_9BACT|nr:hypothetical protein FUAX_17450 [Fulvitalea axinellae]
MLPGGNGMKTKKSKLEWIAFVSLSIGEKTWIIFFYKNESE